MRVTNKVQILIIVLMMVGCGDKDKLILTLAEKQRLEEENRELKTKIAKLKQVIFQQRKEIENLKQIGDKKVEYISYLKEIKLSRLTGPYDADHDGFDDEVIVYLEPIDTDGDCVKVLGVVEVKVFDLGSEPRVVGYVKLPPDKLKKKWNSYFATDHFAIHCPLTAKPACSDITIRVKFIELLTGREFIAEKNCKIRVKSEKSMGSE